jgi:hypothetical protein
VAKNGFGGKKRTKNLFDYIEVCVQKQQFEGSSVSGLLRQSNGSGHAISVANLIG